MTPTFIRALPNPRTTFRDGFRINAPLALMGAAMVLTLVGTLIGLRVDPRVITGAPAWLKPAKFAISILLYSVTLVWMLGFVQRRRGIARGAAWVITGALAVEMVLIIMQVFRNTTSHFNTGTPFDAMVFSIMGVAIMLLWVGNLVVGIVLLREHIGQVGLAWGIRWGILLAVVGMGIAFLMTFPTAAQIAELQAGQGLPHSGAHAVGTIEGGAGLPLVGWSTVGGDLRVPHFFGLHALHVLPLVGWFVGRRGTRFAAATQRRLVSIVGAMYAAGIGILTWQAERGQSVVHPDAATLAAAGAVVIVAGTAFAFALRQQGATGAATEPHTAQVA